MTKVLTPKAIEAKKPDPSKRLEIPDGGLQGLYLVIQKTGAKAWAVRYRAPGTGKPSKYTLGKFPLLGLAQAREAARKALAQVSEGIDPAGVRKAEKAAQRETEGDDRDLVRTVAKEFIKRHASRNRTAHETQRQFDREILPAWGDRKIAEITRRDVIELLDKIADRGATVMANRVLATVRKFGNWCVARDIIPASFAAGVKPVGKESSRERILSDDELRWFWQASGQLGQPFGPLFRMLLITAQRREEVAAMTHAEIDGDTWTIPADRAKNGRAHAVHLSGLALETLEGVKRIAGKPGYVFTTNGRSPASGFSKAKDRLDAMMLAIARDEVAKDGGDPDRVEIPHWTLHDLRRTAASGMARIGINLPVIEKVLNHVSGSFGGIVSVYQRHEFRDEMERALDAWASFIGTLTSEKPADNVLTMEARP
ncbi:MAG: integrase arm-type DNA-binding domain-containing protein [Salinarimonas sp.]|nr:integrase arm-type DNA-binding domain-containing protein [Salinarimonas sp.]